ncbi:MAG TPA: hypothetical protein VJ486_06615 [Geothrix sp.]|nr:hypothetical protein [Geothrix sp.]
MAIEANKTDIQSFSQTYIHHKSPENIFQEFIADLFSNQASELDAFRAQGKDGCIDLFGRLDSAWTVWECKYSQIEGYQTAWARWREVEEKLDRYLVDSGPGTQTQYLPWYDKARPISRYVFCFSGTCGNEENLNKINTAISCAFMRWASVSPKLDHLRDIKVEVLSWDGLRKLVVNQQHILFRYFLNVQADHGISEFKKWIENQKGFRKYLDSNFLPYFPIPGLEPARIFDQLNLPNRLGALIFGGGGTGKSRLLVEVAKIALNKQWAVLVVDVKKFNTNSLRWLLGYVAENPSLLIIDYIEAWDDKDEVIEELDRYNIENIKILGSCRAIQKDFANTDERLIPIEVMAGSENSVSESILSTIPIRKNLRSFCKNIPALAAFCKYMYDNNKLGEFIDSKENTDFTRWLSSRIPSKGTYIGLSPTARLVTTYPCMDEQLDLWQQRDGEVYAVHSFLHRDGWVVGGYGDPYSMAHDIISDQILLSQFHFHDKWRVIRQLLQDGISVKSLPQLFASLQRIKDSLQEINWINISKSFGAQDQFTQRELLSNGLLNSGLLSLPDSIDYLVSIDEVANINALAKLQAVQNSIVRLARAYSRRPDIHTHERTLSLSNWIIIANKIAPENDGLLGVGLLLGISSFSESGLRRFEELQEAPNSFYLLIGLMKYDQRNIQLRESSLKWMNNHIDLFESVYVLREWIEIYGNADSVKELLLRWTSKETHRRSYQAGHLYKIWLQSSGDPGSISELILEWLSVYQYKNPYIAAMVLDAWHRTASTLEVSSAIRAWLRIRTNNIAPPTRYLLGTMLRTGSSPNDVREYLLKWLDNPDNTVYLFTQKLFQDWLDYGGDWESIESYFNIWVSVRSNRINIESTTYLATLIKLKIRLDKTIAEAIEWLSIEENNFDLRAQFILGPLIEMSPDAKIFKLYLDKWLSRPENALNKDAHGIFASWLTMKFDIEYIKPFILKWFDISENINYLRASYIFKPWFCNYQLRDVLKDYLKSWLRNYENCTDIDTEHVFASWLDNGGSYDWVRSEIKLWLDHSENRYSPQARFIFTSCLDAKVPIDEISKHIKEWLSIPKNTIDPQTQHVFRAWGDATNSITEIRTSIFTWLNELSNRISEGASFVYPRLLKFSISDQRVYECINDWMDVPDNFISKNSQYILSPWIEYGKESEQLNHIVIKWMSDSVHFRGAQISFIFQSWAKRKLPINSIKDYFDRWILETHLGRLENTSMVTGSILAYERQLEESTISVIDQFLDKYKCHPELAYVLKQTSKSTQYSNSFINKTIAWCIANPANRRTVQILDNLRRANTYSDKLLYLKALIATLSSVSPSQEIKSVDRVPMFNLVCQALLLSRENRNSRSFGEASRLAKVLIPAIEQSGSIVATAIPWQNRALSLLR